MKLYVEGGGDSKAVRRSCALPGDPHQVEDVPKADVLSGLKRATRDTRKGTYSKGSHGFDVLSALNPEAVEAAAPHARRFLDTLRAGAPT